MIINLREQRYEIKFQDYGYEPDTNAQDIDWEFVEPNDLELTDDEADYIYKLIVTRDQYENPFLDER